MLDTDGHDCHIRLARSPRKHGYIHGYKYGQGTWHFEKMRTQIWQEYRKDINISIYYFTTNIILKYLK